MAITDNKINTLDWEDVDSSAVSRVAYDSMQYNIYVEFSRGAIYRYENCDQMAWTALHDSSSVGQFIHTDLNGKPYTEVTAP